MRAAGAPGTAGPSYRVDATSAEFDAALAGWEARPADEAGAVEQVARAIHQEQNRGAHWELTFERVRDEYRRLAVAALSAMKPSPDAPGVPSE